MGARYLAAHMAVYLAAHMVHSSGILGRAFRGAPSMAAVQAWGPKNGVPVSQNFWKRRPHTQAASLGGSSEVDQT